MASYATTLAALDRILSLDLQSFHQVLLYSEETGENPPLLYLVLGKEELVLCDVHIIHHPVLDEAGAPSMTDYEEEHFPTTRIPYRMVTEMLVHAQMEDRFGLVLADKRPKSLPPVLHMSTCYRKAVISAFQVLHNVASTMRSNSLVNLTVRFVGADMTDARRAYRHPAVKMFGSVPAQLTKGRKVFYRRGYMMLMPNHVIDRYGMLDNRPTSTYVFRPPDPKKTGAASGVMKNPSQMQHLVVRFLPEKPLNPARRDTELEFQLWTESIAQAVAQQEYAEHVDGPIDEYEYQDSFFVPERGVYRKKMNVVGDQSSWTCFRVHMYTEHREIGVIGVRRMFVPPLLDTYQDAVFVMYGDFKADGEHIAKEGFMRSLEEIVDSLSPASAALQTRSKLSVAAARRTTGSAEEIRMHPTYYDRVVIQQRANALYYNKDTYAWLKYKSGLNIVPRTKFIDLECSTLAAIFCRSILALFPKTGRGPGGANINREIDLLLGDQEEEKEEELDEFETVPNQEVAPVADPLSIIFRMQSQSKDASDGDGDANVWKARISRYFAFCVDGGWSRAHLTLKKLTQAASLQDAEEGKRGGGGDGGQSQQAAAGEQPLFMSLENRVKVDKVIDFLLHMKKEGSNTYVQAPNVIAKLRMCQIDDHEIGDGFTFNEWVMARLLETTYLETLLAREGSKADKKSQLDFDDNQGNQASGDSDERQHSTDIFAYLLKALLTKSYDLDLIRSVCLKIVKMMSRSKEGRHQATELDIQPLLEPLIEHVRSSNNYTKTYCIHALIALTKSGEGGQMMVKHPTEPVRLLIQVAKSSKAPQLLQATLKLLVSLYPSVSSIFEDNPLTEPEFVKMLVDMLDTRMKTPQRYHPQLLSEVSQLLLHLTADEEAREQMIDSDLVGKVMSIVKEHRNYTFYLTTFTKTLANLFIQAKDNAAMFMHDKENQHTLTADYAKVAENAKDHAITLAHTLSECASKSKVRVCLYILSILRQLVRMDVSDAKHYRADSERRFEILKHLATTNIAFDRILTTIVQASNLWLTTSEKKEFASGMDDQFLDGEDQEQAEADAQARAERNRIYNMLKELVDWFKSLIKSAGESQWKYKHVKKYLAQRRRQRRRQGSESDIDDDALSEAGSHGSQGEDAERD